MRLARELGMSKRRLLREMDSREIAEWIAYFKLEAKLDKEKDAVDLKAKFQSLVPSKAEAVGKKKRNGRGESPHKMEQPGGH